MKKQIVLSRSWGLSVRDAKKIAGLLGIVGVRFAPAIARGGAVRIAPARLRDYRGARFCAADLNREGK